MPNGLLTRNIRSIVAHFPVSPGSDITIESPSRPPSETSPSASADPLLPIASIKTGEMGCSGKAGATTFSAWQLTSILSFGSFFLDFAVFESRIMSVLRMAQECARTASACPLILHFVYVQ